jgi:hypothetical protein
MLAAACRKVSRCATVAWCKRNFSRKIQTQVNHGPRQELGAARIRMMTLHEKVAQQKEHGLQKKGKDNVAPRIPKGCTCRMKRRKDPADKIGIEDPDTRRQLRLKIGRNRQEGFRTEVMKRATGMSNGLQKFKDWTLWRGRPPSKWKKRRHTEQEPVM